MRDLPIGWVQATLDDLGSWRGGGTPSKSAEHLWRHGTIPWVSPKDMKTSVIEDTQDKLSETARAHRSLKLVPPGSILIVTRSGILKHSLPVAITGREVAINQDIRALVPHAGINVKFLANQLRADAKRILETCVKAGTTVESIDFERLRNIYVNVAPATEQIRIVAKLEPLLARCDLVRSELERVESLSNRQRVAILEAAFRGTLSRERRDRMGMLVAWKTVPLKSLIVGRPANGFSPPTSSDAKGAQSLRLTATTSGVLRLDPQAVKRVHVMPPPDSKYWLKPGDLLVQRANALEHVGAAAIFEGDEHRYIYPDLMMKVRIEDDLVRRYVWRYLNSPGARRYFRANATGTAGNMPKITASVLEALPVPLAPREQMPDILGAIDRLYRRLESVKRDSSRCSLLLKQLESMFLRRAFEGRLVTQQPDDTPAIGLLDRDRNAPFKSAKEKTMKAPDVGSANTSDIRAYIDRKLEVWPVEGFTFEQLREDAPATYDDLKDLLFALIEAGRLRQQYDQRERKMKLVRQL